MNRLDSNVRFSLQENRPFARSGHTVRNKLCRDVNNAVGLPKQRNSYHSSPTFLCFGSSTALFASQHNLFRTTTLVKTSWDSYEN